MSLRVFVAPRALEPTKTTVELSAKPESARASNTGFNSASSIRGYFAAAL